MIRYATLAAISCVGILAQEPSTQGVSRQKLLEELSDTYVLGTSRKGNTPTLEGLRPFMAAGFPDDPGAARVLDAAASTLVFQTAIKLQSDAAWARIDRQIWLEALQHAIRESPSLEGALGLLLREDSSVHQLAAFFRELQEFGIEIQRSQNKLRDAVHAMLGQGTWQTTDSCVLQLSFDIGAKRATDVSAQTIGKLRIKNVGEQYLENVSFVLDVRTDARAIDAAWRREQADLRSARATMTEQMWRDRYREREAMGQRLKLGWGTLVQVPRLRKGQSLELALGTLPEIDRLLADVRVTMYGAKSQRLNISTSEFQRVLTEERARGPRAKLSPKPVTGSAEAIMRR